MNGNPIDPTYRARVLANLDNQKPSDEQVERILKVRHAAKSFVSVLMDNCVFGADLELALARAREANMFGVASIVLEERSEDGQDFEILDRVYHRRADLFGRIVDIKGGAAFVKYEPPYDQTIIEPTEVLLTALMAAEDTPH